MNDQTPGDGHPPGPDGPDRSEEEAALFARLEADLRSGRPTDKPTDMAGGTPGVSDLDADEEVRVPVDPSQVPARADGAGGGGWWSRARSAAAEQEQDDHSASGGSGAVGRFGGGRREVLPGWLRERDTMVWAVRWAAGSAVHALLFHGVRAPVYWGRLVARSPVGTGRLLRAWWAWTFDAAGRDVHRSVTATTVGSRRALTRVGAGPIGAVDRTSQGGFGAGADPAAGMTGRLEAETFLRVASHHRSTVRSRLAVSAAVAAVAGPVAASVAASLTVAAHLAVLAVLLPLVGLAGRSVDRPVTSRATDDAAVPRLTADLIETALGAVGIAELNKGLKTGGTAGVRFPGPITRDGPGWRADVDLPPGVTAGDVIERRDRLASGLRRPLGCVWPEVDPDAHAGRLVLWVGDRPLSGGKPGTWPLTKATATANVFDPVPVGTDQRGRPVTVVLMFAAGIIGAVPRMGKTFLLRLLLLAGALDARCELHVYDLKGGPDLAPLAAVAHRFRIGDEPEDVTYLLADLREMHTDMRRRYKQLRSLPHEVCPESKVTDALAGRADLGLHPVLLGVDECQIAFEHPEHGKAITDLVTDLVKRGPAVGIMVWLATQRPDARSLPTGISANAVLRFCLRVMGQLENDMVLGTSMYKAGVRATMLSRRDKGVAFLAGEGDDPVIVRTAYVDGPTAQTITDRARATRKLAGLLTGHAVGIDTEPSTDVGVLDHLLAVWPGTNTRVWCEDLAQLLATMHPGRYDGWTGEQVTAAVKPHGISTRQVKRRGTDGRPVNRRGLDLHEVRTAHRTANPHTPDHTDDQADNQTGNQTPDASSSDRTGNDAGTDPGTDEDPD
ncbi:MAG: cell division protein FtsK [Actinomycetota bacterium]